MRRLEKGPLSVVGPTRSTDAVYDAKASNWATHVESLHCEGACHINLGQAAIIIVGLLRERSLFLISRLSKSQLLKRIMDVDFVHNGTRYSTRRQSSRLSRMDHPDQTDRHVHSEPHVHVGFGTTLFWWYIALIAALVLLGGVFSGLTLGLMGLDTVCIG